MNKYTFQIQRDGKVWIGWVKELPGINSQAESITALTENLNSALSEYLHMTAQDAGINVGTGFEVVVEQAGNKPIWASVLSHLESSMSENSALGKLLAS